MDDIGCNKLNCAFIFKLSENGFISKKEIVETIDKIIDIKYNIYNDNNDKNDNLSCSDRFLMKNAKMIFDVNVERIYNMITWFFCELIELKNYSIEDILIKLDPDHKNFIQNYVPNDIEKFKKMRNCGVPDDILTKALIQDDVEKLKSFYVQTGWGRRRPQNVSFNLFETYVENGKINCINYAAAKGSINCFKFLFPRYEQLDSNTLCYAIFGQNKEIIDIINQNNDEKFDIDHKISCLPSLFKPLTIHNYEFYPCINIYRNDIFDWLVEKKYNVSVFKIDFILESIFKNGNIHAFIKFIEEGFNLFSFTSKEIANFINISASSGFYRLTQLILSIISKNDEFKFDILNALKVEDFYSFGNLSISKLFSSFDIKNVNFEKALSISIIRNYLDIVKYFFDTFNPEKIKLSSESSLILMKFSIYKKDAELFKYLTNKLVGFDNYLKEFPSQFDDSVLCIACDLGNFEIVKIIYELIDKKKLKFDFTSAFIEASSKGFSEICKFLIEKKAFMRFSKLTSKSNNLTHLNLNTFTLLYNIVEKEEKGQFTSNFLYDAIGNHNKDIVSFLLEKNVSYNYALIKAVSCNDIEITKIILKHDQSPSFINRIVNGETALNTAVLSNSIEIVKILLAIKEINPCIYAGTNKSPLINAFTHNYNDIIDLMLNFYGNEIQLHISELNESLRIIIDSFSITSTAKIGLNPFLAQNKLTCQPQMALTIKKLLAIPNIDLNYNKSKYTLLTFACETNQLDIVSNMINNEKVDINLCQLKDGNSPLMVAIENKNYQIAELLLKKPQINVNIRNYKMKTALILAASANSIKIVELIIKNPNFDPNESRLDCSFMISSKESSLQLLSLKELNVNYKDEENEYEYDTSLMHATKKNDIEKVDKIIHHNSFDPIKSQIKTSIFIASKYDNIEIFRKLLPLINNDVNICSPNNKSLFVVACENNSNDVILEIINNSSFDSMKSQINLALQKLLSNDSGNIPVDILDNIYKYDLNHNHLINFKKLLPNGKSFFTTISLPTDNIDEVVKFLLDHDADTNYPDEFGIYPLQYAIENSSYIYAKMLIDSPKTDLCRKINVIDEENHEKITTSYLHLAAKSYESQILKEILDLDLIDVNMVDGKGDSPLIIAAKNKKFNNISLLFEKDDLDYKHCNNEGDDALAIVKKNNNNAKNDIQPIFKETYLKQLLSFQPASAWGNSWGNKTNTSWGTAKGSWGSPTRWGSTTNAWGSSPTGWKKV